MIVDRLGEPFGLPTLSGQHEFWQDILAFLGG